MCTRKPAWLLVFAAAIIVTLATAPAFADATEDSGVGPTTTVATISLRSLSGSCPKVTPGSPLQGATEGTIPNYRSGTIKVLCSSPHRLWENIMDTISTTVEVIGFAIGVPILLKGVIRLPASSKYRKHVGVGTAILLSSIGFPTLMTWLVNLLIGMDLLA